MKKILLFPLLLILYHIGWAQSSPSKPKLVVGIVIDQFRAEFLDRFYDDFGEAGLKRLMNKGFHYRNAHYNYMPTATGPGHAAVFSGALPEVSGVIGNGWYDRSLGKPVNVVGGKEKYLSVGIADSLERGKAGPDFLLVTTIGDELKKASQFRAKSVAVSIKDRSAILSAGHAADGAYWFDARSGNFITSTYYKDTLPAWVDDFNNSGLADSLNSAIWDLSLPRASYNESRKDNASYEVKMRNQESATFPYNLAKINEGMDHHFYLPYTPFGNELVAELGKSAIKEEALGQRGYTDFMAINFSSTDYAGHRFGPYSIEIQDMYIKLDETIEELLLFLDEEIGKDEYVLFVSADHGAVASPLWLLDNKLPGGVINSSGMASRINEHVENAFAIDSIVLYHDNYQIYMDYERLPHPSLKEDVAATIKEFIENEDFIHSAYTRKELTTFPSGNQNIHQMLLNSFHPKRSGDIFYISNPGWLSYAANRIATGHGSPHSYDTHIPIMFFGKDIPAGSTVRKVAITDIAPTLSLWCRVMLPSGARGEPLWELWED